MKRLLMLAVVLLALLAGCTDLLGPTTGTIPPGAVEVQAPANFAGIWTKVEQCSGRTRAFDDVRWFMVPGVLDFEYEGRAVYGLYQYPRRITLAEYAMFLDSAVAHEMLHAITRDGGHDRAEWGKCAGVVTL